MDKDRGLYIRLFNLLQPYSSWFDIEGKEGVERNQKAKEILYVFYEELSNLKPATRYEKRGDHGSYLFHLLHIRRAFEEERYMRACHEIQTLLYYEPFMQSRIQQNLLRMLERYLHIKEGKARC